MDFDEIRNILQRRGAKFNRTQKEIDISRPVCGVVGINTLGKLAYFEKLGYRIILPDYKFKEIR